MITEKEAIDILTSPDEIYQDVDGLVGYTYNPRKRNYEAFQLAVKGLEQLKEQTRWIPMVRREPTDEEKEEYLAQNGEELCYMLENEMPLNGQEVLVSIGEFVAEDVFDEDFYNFESNDIENVDAWMPKPKAYKAESEPQKSDIEKHKKCINYEDGCEEWAGCPCVYYKAESEDKNADCD